MLPAPILPAGGLPPGHEWLPTGEREAGKPGRADPIIHQGAGWKSDAPPPAGYLQRPEKTLAAGVLMKTF